MDDSQFFEHYRGMVVRIAKKYTSGAHQEAEDLATEILLKAIGKRGECKGKKIDPWLSKLANRYCIDQYRKKTAKKAIKFVDLASSSPSGLDGVGDARQEEVRRSHEGLETAEKYPWFRRLQESAPEKVVGLERSLEMVHDIYRVISSLNKDRRRMQPLIKAARTIEECRESVSGILGPVPAEAFHAYRAVQEIEFPVHGDPDYEKKQAEYRKHEPAVQVQYNLHSAKSEIDGWLMSSPSLNSYIHIDSQVADEFCMTSIGRQGEAFWGPLYRRLDLLEVRLDPLKLLYNIWHRAFQKGKYGNRRLLEHLLCEYGRMKQGTDLAYIFEPLERDKSMESLRTKSLYGLTQITNDLAAFIHRKSFGGPADPDAPVYERTAHGVNLRYPPRHLGKK
jgi:RNA polymerase sigma factor (sigma-70 family)